MPNENPEVVPEPTPNPEPAPNVQIAPDFETEFNNAFEKSLADFKVKEPVEPKEPNVPKPEAKVDPKPEVKKVDDGPLPDPESVDQAPTGKGKEGWNSLRNNYKKAHQLAKDREEKIKKLESTLAERGTIGQKEVESLKSQIEELSRYRAMVDIQADPEFVSKYDQPIEKIKDSLKTIFRELRDVKTGQPVSEETINQIDFANSAMVDRVLDGVEESGAMDKFTINKVRRKVEEILDLNDKRNETLQEHKKNYKEHLESKKKESFARDAEAEGKTLQHLEAIAGTKDKDGNVMFPFLNRIQAKEGDDQAQIDRINAHNKMVDLMTGRVQEVLKMNKPEEKSEVAVAAVASHYLSAQLRGAKDKIKALEEELKKISTAGSETERTKLPTVRRAANGQFVDVDDALAAHFNR